MSAQLSSQSMRERILAAAIEVIRERGVTAATTKEIARVAQVAEGSLYNHFENKTALFGAAFMATATGIREAVQTIGARVGERSVEDNLAEWAAAAVRFYVDLLPMTGPVLANHDVLGWLQQNVFPQGGGPVQGHAALARYLRAEQEAGRLAAEAQPEFIAAALLGACQQYAFLSLLVGQAALTGSARLPADIDEYARQVVRTVLNPQLPAPRAT
jgi:AcrR family transcriptional regulator